MILAGSATGVSAQSLGEAFVVNPYPNSYYQTFLAAVTVAWNFKIITLSDPDRTLVVNIDGKEYSVYADVYADEEVAWELGQTLPNDSSWGNELVIDFSDEAYEAGYPVGDYVINIPAGLIVDENGNTNEDQTLVFHKVDLLSPETALPESGMYAPSDLREARITFGDGITIIGEGLKVTIGEKDEWLTERIVLEDIKVADDGKTLVIGLDGLEMGINYSLNIPQGFVLIGDDYINEEVWLYYMIWEGMDEATLISAPLQQSSPEVKPFILTWDYQQIRIAADAPDTEFVCGYPDYGIQDGWRTFIPSDFYELVHVTDKGEVIHDISTDYPANALYLDVTELTDGFAGYRFEIFFPAGLVENNEGLMNPPLSYSFEVKNIWPDPQVVIEDNTLQFYWKGAFWVTFALSRDEVTLSGPQDYFRELQFDFGDYSGEITILNESTFNGMIVNLDNLDLEDGKYTLNVPQGYVYLEGVYGEFVINGAFEYSFEWKDGEIYEGSGVEGIFVQDDVLRVYTLGGIKVMETENVSDLDTLPGGLYIINGKKRVIKQ